MVQRGRPECRTTLRTLDLNNVQEAVVGFHQEIRYVLCIDVPLFENPNELASEHPAIGLEPTLPRCFAEILTQHLLELPH